MPAFTKTNDIKKLAAEVCGIGDHESDDDEEDDYVDYSSNENGSGTEIKDESVLHNLEEFKEYRLRPPTENFYNKHDSGRDELIFQLNELQYETDRDLFMKGQNGLYIRIFGVTSEGYSVCANVKNYLPYFAVAWGDNATDELSIAAFKSWLESNLRQRLSNDNDYGNAHRRKRASEGKQPETKRSKLDSGGSYSSSSSSGYSSLHSLVNQLVVSHELCSGHDLCSFNPNEQAFLKIYFAYPQLVSSARKLIEEEGPSSHWHIGQTYESDVDFVIRYKADMGYTGEMTLSAPAGSYRLITAGKEIRTNTDIELEIDYRALQAVPKSDPRFITIGKKVMLSYDIESEPYVGKEKRKEGRFPRPHLDRVLQIGAVLWMEGEDDDREQRFVFCLGSVTAAAVRKNHPGATVFCYDSEAKLLLAWSEFFVTMDPDIITGYNIENFDNPYLNERAETLAKSYPALRRFPYLGRVRYRRSVVRDARFESKAHGLMDRKEMNLDGRVQLDMLYFCQKKYKLRSYKLEAVCQKFLGVGKEQMDYELIPEYQKSRAGRTKLASYVITDALRPKQLMDKLRVHLDSIEMARVTGITIQSLIRRGMGFRLKKQLYTWVRKPAHDITNLKGETVTLPETKYFIPTRTAAERERTATGDGYKGAVVIDALRGQYEWLVATLDFSSLYPSIMMEKNMSPDTRTTVAEMRAKGYVLDEDYYQIPDYKFGEDGRSFEEVYSDDNVCFVTPKIRKGIVPILLECILGERKKAKGRMAAAEKEGDSFRHMLENICQNNLKLNANSIYGGFGAATSFIYCKEIAESVTKRGRAMILKTRYEIEKKFCKKNGYSCDVQVVYGDTDSVFVHCPGCSKEETLTLSKEMSTYASSLFGYPHKLEAEKVYKNLIIYKKKKYAGIKYEIDQATMTYKAPERNIMGLESVRRDNCIFVVETQDNLLSLLLSDKASEERKADAIAYVKKQTRKLLLQKVTWDKLIISGQLRQHPEDYKANNAVSSLAKRVNIRNAGAGYIAGDRVPYVITKQAPRTKTIDCSEDPEYAWKNNVPLDTDGYYLKQQLMPAVMRTMAPILTPQLDIDVAAQKRKAFEIMIGALFWGEHMNVQVMQRSSSSLDAIFKPMPKCFRCKCILRTAEIYSHNMLCSSCAAEHGDEIIAALSTKLQKQHIKDGSCWKRCQECVGATDQCIVVKCKNYGCDNMWKREHIAHNKKELREKIAATVHACNMELDW